MNEVNLRIANFLKLISMVMVIVSLLYTYAYTSEDIRLFSSSVDWLKGISKSHIFYIGLALFAVFNLLMHGAVNFYKGAEGYDKSSTLFQSAERKESLVMWFTFLLAGINIFFTSIIIYIALISINEVKDSTDYLSIPVFGMLVLLGFLIGLIVSLIKKQTINNFL